MLTKIEVGARTALLAIDSYDVSLDLTTTPVRSRTVVRFRRASGRLRAVLKEQEAELRTAITVKAVVSAARIPR